MSMLYIVGTPIGNLSDITLRAVEVLKNCDYIACEDTRHTMALLNRLEIKKPLISYYKQKEREKSVYIAELVESGKDVALVSDAGMPCISDPGSVVVREFMARNLKYTVIPGPNAAVCAAALVGIDGAFTFLGFLPEKQKEREHILQKHARSGANLIIYSAPHDLNKNLDFLYSVLGDRRAYIVKEISKIYERVTSGTLKTLRDDSPKGEYVIVIEPTTDSEATDEEIINTYERLVGGGMSRRDAVNETVEALNVSKNRVYKLTL